MMVQRRADPFAATRVFADGRVMRAPPAGTAPYEARPYDPAREEGYVDGRAAPRVPIPLTRAVLELGRHHFDRVCAACHGVLGDGVSVVARAMRLRPPPSLHVGPPATKTPGEVFRVVSVGYGLMPSYAHTLDVDERWAVVAYLSALRLSQRAAVASLPPLARQRALESLR